MLDVVVSPEWRRYFDAFTMPVDVLSSLSDNISFEELELEPHPIGTVVIGDQPFPELTDCRTNHPRAFVPGISHVNPAETLVSRVKANREHGRILAMLASKLRVNGHPATENTFIDLCSLIDTRDYIFEVKTISQPRSHH